MAPTFGTFVIGDLRGGRNGYLPAWAIAENQCADAVNIDWYQTTFARKRGGTSAFTFLGTAPGGKISSLARHVPATDDTAAEMWLADDAGTTEILRLAGGTSWAAPTLKDNPTGNSWDFSWATCNGKLFIAYKSAQGRLHCWDGSTVRRTGISSGSTAPTVANTGGGTYAAVARYYRVRFCEFSGGFCLRRSEPTSSVVFTPSGTGTAARVTRPTAPSEGENFWELEASADGITFYKLYGAEGGFVDGLLGDAILLATTTGDDTATVDQYADGMVSVLTGTYTLQKSYRFLAADQGRLLGFGSWTTTDKQNDIEISAVIGSLDVGDVERVDTATTNFRIGLDENDSGIPAGLIGPITGSFLAYKSRQTFLLTPTSNTTAPYRVDALSKSVGLVYHAAVDRGEDESGNAAAYWMSHRGPYTWGLRGVQYIGQGIEDLILGPTSTINLGATHVVAWTRFFPDKRQVWFAFATGASNDPDTLCIYDVRNKGWSRFTGGMAAARCCVMFSNTVGASMSRDLKPWIGQTGGAATLWKCDTGTDDAGSPFQAYVITKAAEPGGPGFNGRVGDAMLLAKAATGVTITDTVTADFGLQTKQGTALLTAAAAETRVSVPLGDSAFAGCQFVQHQIGDGSAASNAWALDRLIVPYLQQEPVVTL